MSEKEILEAIETLRQMTDDELLAVSGIPEYELRSPWRPTQRQQDFLEYGGEEAMYGGAVGGGKSEVLLAWLREGIQHDGFSGLFLRRTFAQIQGSPTSPIERSWKFFKAAGGTLVDKIWKFPNKAMIRFGHMQHEDDKHNYDGPEFHRICFDQIEQFSETQYTYMFSRMRRTKGYPIPCGVRSAANPIGGNWVKTRFVTAAAIQELSQFSAYDPTPKGMSFTAPNGAKFFPSRIADNPYIEVEEYVDRLRSKLGAVLAAKLASGDWSVVEGSVIDSDDFRYYTMHNRTMVVERLGTRITASGARLKRFAVVDTAGTSQQKAKEKRGKPASWSVCAVFDYWPEVGLFVRDVWRQQVGWPELRDQVQEFLGKWGNPLILIENAHHGQVLHAELRGRKKLVSTAIGRSRTSGTSDGAKYDRAVESGLLAIISAKRLYLPDIGTVDGAASWMPEFESEILGWTGHPDETADQVDVCSHAAKYVRSATTEWGGVL